MKQLHVDVKLLEDLWDGKDIVEIISSQIECGSNFGKHMSKDTDSQRGRSQRCTKTNKQRTNSVLAPYGTDRGA